MVQWNLVCWQYLDNWNGPRFVGVISSSFVTFEATLKQNCKDPWTYEVKPTSQPTKHLGRLPASCFQFGVNVPNRYCHKFYFLANLLFLFALRAGTGCAKSPRCVDLIFFRFIGVRSTFYFVLLLPLLSIVSFVESVFQLLFWTSLQKICAFRSLCYRWHKLPLGVLTFWVYAEASY